jgi:UDP-N-acetylmuramoyl-tripeptide--D-alanyl-D-alanine ligase
MSGQVITGDPATTLRGAVLDSRRIEGGELFFALAGEQTDGHAFVVAALEGGAAAAVVHEDVEFSGTAPVIRVADTFDALHALTSKVRQTLPRWLVGVTGSAGKTTTKDLLARMLASRYRTAASPGNLNNLYGFPLALLNLAEDTEWMVAEMGMSEPGELGRLSLLARPDLVIVNNVRPAHLESFGSLRAVADAKAEILQGLSDGGTAVLNAADPEVVAIGARCQRARPDVRIEWFGLDCEPDSLSAELPEPLLRVRDLELAPGGEAGSRFVLELAGSSVAVSLSLPGAYNVENCLAAATAAIVLGCDLEAVAEAASSTESIAMRGRVSNLPGGARLWDDSYNSNPDALARTLAAAAQLGSDRRWAVLGDMLELGRAAAEFHRSAGREAARLGFSPIVGVGPLSRELVRAASAAGTETEWFETAREAAEYAATEVRGSDLVLVKGSRGVGLEAVVAALREGD